MVTKKKEFAAAALDPEHETFIVYVASLASSAGVHPSRRPSIAGLIPEEAPTVIPAMAVATARTVMIGMTSFSLPDKLRRV